jgi:hypothetical protein
MELLKRLEAFDQRRPREAAECQEVPPRRGPVSPEKLEQLSMAGSDDGGARAHVRASYA